jgi:hypothetical protein
MSLISTYIQIRTYTTDKYNYIGDTTTKLNITVHFLAPHEVEGIYQHHMLLCLEEEQVSTGGILLYCCEALTPNESFTNG